MKPPLPPLAARIATVASRIIAIAVAAVAVLTGSVSLAQDQLLRLLPPDAPVLAGMQRATADNEYDRIWLATAKNLGDMNDFVSLTDTDVSRRIDRVIVADTAAGADLLGEHLLLAEGHFSPSGMRSPRISLTAFAGMPVFAVDSNATNTRWLAVLQSKYALFGSPAAVKQALLRYKNQLPADSSVVARIQRVPRNDIAWSSITLDSAGLRSHLQLHGYERTILPCLTNTEELVVGVRFDAQAWVDMRVIADSKGDASAASVCLQGLGEPLDRVSLRTDASMGGLMATVSFGSTRERYRHWIDAFHHPVDEQLFASAAVPGTSGR